MQVKTYNNFEDIFDQNPELIYCLSSGVIYNLSRNFM